MAGAPLRILDDTTALDGDHIELAPRIGWLVRMARLTGDPAGPVSRAALVGRVHALGAAGSMTRLHRLEAGERGGRDYHAVEAAMGLRHGQLRAAVDLVCGSFPTAPPPRADDPRPTVVSLSAAYERITGAAVTGGDWLDWARGMAHPESLGLPLSLADEAIARLVSELPRAIGTAYTTRYCALVLLLKGPYAEVALDQVRQFVADPDAQVPIEAFSAVSDTPRASSLAWMIDCLADDRPRIVESAAAAIANASTVVHPRDRLDVWGSALDAAVDGYNAAEGQRREALGWLLRAFPVRLKREIRARVTELPPPPPRSSPKGTKTAENPGWAEATTLCTRISDRIGILPRPVLTRLLFEALHDHREVRSLTACILMGAVPFAQTIAEVLVESALRSPDPSTRAHLLRRAGSITWDDPPGLVPELQQEADAEVESIRLRLLAHAGVTPARSAVEALVTAGATYRERAAYAAGMTGMTALLTDWSAGRRRDLAAAARWWLRHGARIADPPRDVPG